MCIVPLQQVFPLNPQHVTVNCWITTSEVQVSIFAFIWRPVLGLHYYYISFWSEFYALFEYHSNNVHILIFILPAMCLFWHFLSWHVETILILTVPMLIASQRGNKPTRRQQTRWHCFSGHILTRRHRFAIHIQPGDTYFHVTGSPATHKKYTFRMLFVQCWWKNHSLSGINLCFCLLVRPVHDPDTARPWRRGQQRFGGLQARLVTRRCKHEPKCEERTIF